MKNICVFCGSSVGNDGKYLEAASRLGALIAGKNAELVYGGANVGMMGALANACLAGGGRVTGVMPRHLVDMGVAHEGLHRFEVVATMHERKALMCGLSDGFISLPGGIGTLDETFEILSWQQLGIHTKPVGILNLDGFYDDLLRLLEKSVDRGFFRREHLDMVLFDDEVARLVSRMEQWKPVIIDKWFDKDFHKV